jgi:RNA polymerase sigma-70 factor (ECF subfamily)
MENDVRLAAAGDLAAFEKIYHTYYRRVFSRCLRMTRSVSESEDLTQDIFVQLFRKLKTFRGESSFTTWLHRLTINVVLMHFRKTSRRLEQASEDIELASEPVQTRGSWTRLQVMDRLSLDEAIRQLAPGYRAVLVLHDVEGYEHKEIAEIIGCSEGTSKSQLHKARMRLRQFLTKRPAAQQDCPETSLRSLQMNAQPTTC